MALISATCSDCGDVELRSRGIRVRTCTDTDESTYLFRCPVCRMIEVRPAAPHVVDVLLAAGCIGETWSLPSELNDPRRSDSSSITHDDVLDFHIALAEYLTEQMVATPLPVTMEGQQDPSTSWSKSIITWLRSNLGFDRQTHPQ
jgi:hypothetical protein